LDNNAQAVRTTPAGLWMARALSMVALSASIAPMDGPAPAPATHVEIR
jgi:hypothetical protein